VVSFFVSSSCTLFMLLFPATAQLPLPWFIQSFHVPVSCSLSQLLPRFVQTVPVFRFWPPGPFPTCGFCPFFPFTFTFSISLLKLLHISLLSAPYHDPVPNSCSCSCSLLHTLAPVSVSRAEQSAAVSVLGSAVISCHCPSIELSATVITQSLRAIVSVPVPSCLQLSVSLG
jgi:hypothetical protein